MNVLQIILLIIAIIFIVVFLYSYLYKQNLGQPLEIRTLDANINRIELSTAPARRPPWNASIAKLGNTYIVPYRSSSTRNIIVGMSRLIYTVMDSNTFEIKKEIILPEVPAKHDMITGYEDPRVFVYKDQVYIMAVVYTKLTLINSTPKMHLLHLDMEKDKLCKDITIDPTYEGKDSPQKNWNYLEYQGSTEEMLKLTNHYHNRVVLIVVKVEPHTIISLDLNTGENKLLYTTSCQKLKHKYKTTEKKLIHGGTKPIKLTEEGRYVAMCHTKVKGFNMTYRTIFYEFDNKPPFAITRFSNEFGIQSTEKGISHKIQMVMGLENHNENEVIITLGANDNDMYAITFNKSKIEELLEENVC